MRIILATSNGSGMGHLARQSAVGLALTKRGLTPVLFSLSTALPLALGLPGLTGEYCPSYARGWMPRRAWETYLSHRLQALVAETAAAVVVFDGVVPYPGLLRARKALPHTAFVWCRRGLWQPGLRTWALRAAPFFDAIIEPGDLAAGTDQGATANRRDAQRLAPIALIEQVPGLPRAEAAAVLGLSPDLPTALVTLPFAAATGVQSAVTQLLAAGWQVALTAGPIGAQLEDPLHNPGLVHLRGVFPLARYLAAFDVAVAAAGYNAVHEFLLAGLPTVLVPRRETRTDDQAARARWAVAGGYAIVASDTDGQSLTEAVTRIQREDVRAEITHRLTKLPRPTGATEAAEVLEALAQRWSPPVAPQTTHSLGLSQRGLLATLAARDLTESVVGAAGMARLRRFTGRRPAPPPTSAPPSTPRPGAGYVTTDTADPAELAALLTGNAADQPVEHLLADSSPTYRSRRQQIADQTYH